MPDWSAMYAPRSGKRTDGELDPGELIRQMTDAYRAVYGPMLENLTRYWGGSTAYPWMTGAAHWPGVQDAPTWRRRHTHGHGHRHKHHCDCGCHEGDCDGCCRDDCHCRCCITDADLVVHARLGEMRVVPLTIENPRRRERQVKLELSDFTTRSGSPADVRAQVLPPTEFTLAPCSEREVVIGVQVRLKSESEKQPGGVANRKAFDMEAGIAGMAAGAQATVEQPQRVRLPDVEHCEVYYADLRAEGCDLRPVRIAVVVLPRDCDAHPIDCGCGCC
jgi:hypothetical protein